MNQYTQPMLKTILILWAFIGVSGYFHFRIVTRHKHNFTIKQDLYAIFLSVITGPMPFIMPFIRRK